MSKEVFEIIEKYSMSQGEALDIIQKEADSLGLQFLETMIYMQDNMHEYGSVERCAYRVAFRNFQKLFAPKESV
jgi:hypothetical protein